VANHLSPNELAMSLLPSWADTATRRTILEFVTSISDPEQASYVVPAHRIAVFDNDGTLWAEKPLYFQLVFLLERLHHLAPSHPEWNSEEPFKTALSGDPEGLKSLKIPDDALKLLAVTHTGMTQAEFMHQVRQFLGTARHPRFGQLYPRLIYQPMRELIDYLQQQQFKVFICSAGGLDFMRAFSETAYGIPPEYVIGSSICKSFEMTSAGAQLLRHPAIVPPINNRGGKPILIDRHIGRRPILAAGNSAGDIEMLTYTANHPSGPGFSLLICHDDGDREYDYQDGAEEAIALAEQNNWLTVSMKSDFKHIFPTVHSSQDLA
jgi:phosphoglycolate phosphatase-like HAD superfamily hydrolase